MRTSPAGKAIKAVSLSQATLIEVMVQRHPGQRHPDAGTQLSQDQKWNIQGQEKNKNAITLCLLDIYNTVPSYVQYSAPGNVFTVLYFFHILLCFSRIPKWITFIFT